MRITVEIGRREEENGPKMECAENITILEGMKRLKSKRVLLKIYKILDLEGL